MRDNEIFGASSPSNEGSVGNVWEDDPVSLAGSGRLCRFITLNVSLERVHLEGHCSYRMSRNLNVPQRFPIHRHLGTADA